MWAWKIAWRQSRAHPVRALLTCLSVVIGVAVVLAVGVSTGTTRRVYHQMYQTINGRAALEITRSGGVPLDASLLDAASATPGVEAAIPLLQRETILYYDRGQVKLVALGIDPTRESVLRDYQQVAGSPLTNQGGVLLDASLASSLGIKVGDRIRLLVLRGDPTTKVVGLVQPRSGAAVGNGSLLFMPLRLAQLRFNAYKKLDRIQIVADESADLAQVQAELLKRLPVGTQVHPPTTHSALAEETSVALENGLRLATAFTVMAAIFVTLNTFLMNVGQRRRQISVMRAIGGTRRQMAGMVFREALLLGIVGTVPGLLLGAFGAVWLNIALSTRFQIALPKVDFTVLPVVIAVLFGLGISMLGAWLPARQAARLTPLEGMNQLAPVQPSSRAYLNVGLGVCILLSSLGLYIACLRGWLPVQDTVVFSVTMLVGLVMLLPLVLRPLTGLGQLLLSPWAAVETRLARRQLLRHRGRTSLTIGVLFVAIATSLGLGMSIRDNVEDVRNWYRTVVVGDFFVRAANPDMATGLSATLPDSVGREIAAIDGLSGLESLRFVAATAADMPVVAIVSQKEFPQDGSPGLSAFFRLAPQAGSSLGNGVAIGSVLAERSGLKVGDSIVVQSKDGSQSLPIRAVVNEYLAGGLTIHLDRTLAEKLLGIEGVDGFVIKADHAKLKQVESALQAVCQKNGLLLQSYSDLTRMIEGMMSEVVGSLWGLLVLILIVACFGLVNTLGMNILEQTKELAVLRVVAMTRGQIRRLILAQASMLSLLGIIPGVLCGIGLAYVMNRATLPVVGHPVAFSVSPLWVLIAAIAVFALSALASWLPAERAARSPLSEALRYE